MTPSLHHVTNVGGAKFDRVTGEQVGGGISPDVMCDASRQGIPSNIGADLCVGIALDVLEEAESTSSPLMQQETQHFASSSSSTLWNGAARGPIDVDAPPDDPSVQFARLD